jgi:hypothetical protein
MTTFIFSSFLGGVLSGITIIISIYFIGYVYGLIMKNENIKMYKDLDKMLQSKEEEKLLKGQEEVIPPFNVVVNNNILYINSVPQETDITKIKLVKITGPLINLDCDKHVVIQGTVKGNIECGGNCYCDDIEGYVDVIGDICCKNISNKAEAGRDIFCTNISGDATAYRDITIKKVKEAQ